MIDTTTIETVADLDTATDEPMCEAILQCAEQCCEPFACREPAAARVTFRCASSGCDHAGDLLLLCERHTAEAGDIGRVLARRPL